MGKGLCYKLKILFLMSEAFESAVFLPHALTAFLSVLSSLKKPQQDLRSASLRTSSMTTVTTSTKGHQQGQKEAEEQEAVLSPQVRL